MEPFTPIDIPPHPTSQLITWSNRTFFFEDTSGTEHAFKLEDFNLSCREGHEIIIVKLLVNNAKSGHFIGLYNHSTHEGHVKYGLFQTMTRPSRTPSCLIALLAPFVIGIVLAFLLDIVLDDIALKDALILLTFGSSFAIWIVLLVLYQNRKFRKLKDAYDNLPI